MSISKELLSEVLGITFLAHKVNKNTVRTYYCEEQYNEWNIYELAHTCKEWAFNKGYDLLSAYYQDCSIIDFKNGKEVWLVTTSTDTPFKECIDIFKACQWILDTASKG